MKVARPSLERSSTCSQPAITQESCRSACGGDSAGCARERAHAHARTHAQAAHASVRHAYTKRLERSSSACGSAQDGKRDKKFTLRAHGEVDTPTLGNGGESEEGGGLGSLR